MQTLDVSLQGSIKAAARALIEGNLVAFPTETVYGLGADALNADAVRRIYQVKKRPLDHPLIVHISSVLKMTNWAIKIPDYAYFLARDFWPGPMTLILKRTELARDFVTGNQDTVAIRVPAHPVALGLLTEFESLGGLGIAAPSANKFGALSPTNALDVKEELGDLLSQDDLILVGAQCQIGIESTIIDCTHKIPSILRPGSITEELVEGTLGYKVSSQFKSKIRASGTLQNHYLPKTKVTISSNPNKKEGFIALSNITTPNEAIRLAAPENTNSFANQLYAALRKADHLKLKSVSIVPPEGDGIAVAIRDRIQKMVTDHK
jgi:L-threonylcarbamoyladenylate synthase